MYVMLINYTIRRFKEEIMEPGEQDTGNRERMEERFRDNVKKALAQQGIEIPDQPDGENKQPGEWLLMTDYDYERKDKGGNSVEYVNYHTSLASLSGAGVRELVVWRTKDVRDEFSRMAYGQESDGFRNEPLPSVDEAAQQLAEAQDLDLTKVGEGQDTYEEAEGMLERRRRDEPEYDPESGTLTAHWHLTPELEQSTLVLVHNRSLERGEGGKLRDTNRTDVAVSVNRFENFEDRVVGVDYMGFSDWM